MWLLASVLAGRLATLCPAQEVKKAMSARGPLTIHVLDTATGKPGAGLPVRLERQADKGFVELAQGKTDADGRINDLYPDKALRAGVYRVTFDTGSYFRALNQKTFYPRVEVLFEIERTDEHYHIPLILGPFGYTTYRGS